MGKSVIECHDDRGDRLEAHCTQKVGDPHNHFAVEVVSEKGLRGVFVIDVPDGVPLGTALQERIRLEGIHAHN